MSGAWTINAGGKLYGPFSLERMRGFASEGRLAPDSMIAQGNANDWHEARNEPEFADLFASQRTASPSSAPAVTEQPQTPAAVARISPRPGTTTDEAPRTQFAIIVDLKTRGSANLERAIASLGPSYQLLPNTWIVSTDQTANAVRNRLMQELGKSDPLFVIDATRGKAAWFNFGPDADAHIRRVWQKTA
jgi:hypothetical protein